MNNIEDRCSLQDLNPNFDFGAAESKAESTVECTVLYSPDSQCGHKGSGTDPVPAFMEDLPEVLFSIFCNKREGAVTHIFPILQPAAFDQVVFGSYMKMGRTVTTSVGM